MTDTAHAFGNLYDLYAKEIYRFLYYRTNNVSVAEDLTSTVFTKALADFKRFTKRSGATERSWLYTIARNALIDHYRSQKQTEEVSESIAGTDDVSKNTDERMLLQKVVEAMKTLPEAQQEILRLRLWQGLTHQEIADTIGKSEASVKMAFSRALQELRSRLPETLILLLLPLFSFLFPHSS